MVNKAIRRCLTICSLLVLSTHCLADTVWVDVRTPVEHAIDNIDGDIRISHTDIVPEVEKLFPDKNTQIKLYCRSGGRAGTAAQALKEAGYTDVENIGGINKAREARAPGR